METKQSVPIAAKLKMTVTRKDGSVEVIEPKIVVKENEDGNDSNTD